MLFDQNVPRPLRRFLKACEVKIADEMGWGRTRNGLLLEIAEQEGFEVLLTGDRTIQYEQNMHGRRISLVSMSDNHWRIVRDYVVAIEEAGGAGAGRRGTGSFLRDVCRAKGQGEAVVISEVCLGRGRVNQSRALVN